MHPLPPRSAAVATSLLALVALVCVVLGAGRVLGPVLITTGRDVPFEPEARDRTAPPAPSGTQNPLDLPTEQDSGSFGTVLLVLLALLAVAVVAAIVWILVRAHRLRAGRRDEAEELPEDTALLEVAHARRALAGASASLEYAATPRDGIVEAWLALEAGIAHAGIARRPTWTTTEYVVSVLGDLDLPDADLHVLADLYGRALFDDAGIDEDDRARAGAALENLTGRLVEEAR